MIAITLGEKIRNLRKAKGMTQVELAKRLNTTKQTIGKYETGIVSNIPIDKILEIAYVLECDASELIEWKHSELYDLDMLKSISEEERSLKEIQADLKNTNLSESERDDLEFSESVLLESIETKKFMLSQGLTRKTKEPVPEEDRLSDDEKLLIKLFRQLPEDLRRSFLVQLRAIAEAQVNKNEKV